ncbi:MAG: stage II sporulation protein D [Ruminococcus sp.]|nr:stage II sporulation protein D [Ruminococcus sp.]
MNRLLILVVMILVPVAVLTKSDEQEVLKGETLENIKLEIPILSGEASSDEDKGNTVLISNNKDKSNPYYVDLEEYIIGVVAGEMPASFNMEALKAQAVAARTYAIYKMQNLNNYVLSTTVSDQVYLDDKKMMSKWGNDYEYYYNRVKEAVEETKGEVLTYNGDVIIAYYFAISNGYTEDAKDVFNENRDYLVSVESNWDKKYQSYASNRTISKNTFCSKLGITCDTVSIGKVIRSDNNYVREITINGKKFTGLEVFRKLGLKSTDFTITVNNNEIVIKTLGFGHSVGMSQYGAQGMASEGYSYQDILKHYYKNTEIANI